MSDPEAEVEIPIHEVVPGPDSVSTVNAAPKDVIELEESQKPSGRLAKLTEWWRRKRTVAETAGEIAVTEETQILIADSDSVTLASTAETTSVESAPATEASVARWWSSLVDAVPFRKKQPDVPAVESAAESVGGDTELAEFRTDDEDGTSPGRLSRLGTVGSIAVSKVQSGVVSAIIGGIRTISSERDRDEILCWFMNARQILADSPGVSESANALYRSIDTVRFAQLLANTFTTSLYSYKGSSLPLALKVAIPVTLIGAGAVGMKGAGIVAFGSGIGFPVVVLLFLGTAGVTSILEAFVKDRSIRDPLTKLLLMFVAFETTRRAKKELLDALRADAMVPQRADVHGNRDELLRQLMAMDPVEFERHVMSFFERSGHPTGLTARSNDFGVDGYVFHPDGLIIVQCKRYSANNPVGREAIQQFKGVIEEQRAFRGYFVTTSRFTTPSIESAGLNERIVLIDGGQLLNWHLSGQIL
jgi:hypothetical protein